MMPKPMTDIDFKNELLYVRVKNFIHSKLQTMYRNTKNMR